MSTSSISTPTWPVSVYDPDSYGPGTRFCRTLECEESARNNPSELHTEQPSQRRHIAWFHCNFHRRHLPFSRHFSSKPIYSTPMSALGGENADRARMRHQYVRCFWVNSTWNWTCNPCISNRDQRLAHSVVFKEQFTNVSENFCCNLSYR